MSGFDYSKWDKIDVSSSDSEDGDDNSYDDFREEKQHHGTKVTRLQYPSQVVVGPNGVHMTTAPAKAKCSPFLPANETNNAAEHHMNTNHQLATTTAPLSASASNAIDVDDMDEDDILYHNLVRNGGREGAYHLWCQSSDSVTVSFMVPAETRSKHIHNFRIYTVENPSAIPIRQSVVEFTVQHETEMTTVSRSFRYPIKDEEELVSGCWQLQTIACRNLRLLVVQVFKEPIGVGITHWWDRCFVTDVEALVDTSTLQARGGGGGMASSNSNAAKRREEFSKVWEEAHTEFKRRVQERNKTHEV